MSTFQDYPVEIDFHSVHIFMILIQLIKPCIVIVALVARVKPKVVPAITYCELIIIHSIQYHWITRWPC